MLSHLVGLRDQVNPLHPRDPALAELWGEAPSSSGQVVNPKTALSSSVVFACVRNTAETLASLPCLLKRIEIDDKNRRRVYNAINHPLFPVLSQTPNRWQTAFEFWELAITHLELRGNSYSYIVRNAIGQVTELIPIHPDTIMPFWTRDKMPAYQWTPMNGPSEVLLFGEVLHIRNFTYGDGLLGSNPIKMHRETIGVALASRDHGARLFANDARPRGVLYTDKTLFDPAQKRMAKDWGEKYGGQNRGRIAILEEGLKYTSLSMSNEDAQYIQSRGWDALEIARLFRTPPSKVGITEKSTFNNVEQQNRNWVTDKIGPITRRCVMAVVRDCLTATGRKTFAPLFDLAGLLMGDLKARTDHYSKGIQWGWWSPNDVREKEGENPIEEGDVYRSPLNMGPLDKIDENAPNEDPPEPPDPPAKPEPDFDE